jgi:hypothetical protein
MDLSPESFERLLNWLHPNREEAGQEYQRIQAVLTKHFQSHGCYLPDKLADATMDRVGRVLTTGKIENWVGAKERYFFRVGFYILLEERERERARPEMQIPDGLEVTGPEQEDLEPESHCLEECLQKLAVTDRELIERYYRGEKAIKKKSRVELARDLKIDLRSLRVRAHRIRKGLRECINKCLQEAQA